MPKQLAKTAKDKNRKPLPLTPKQLLYCRCVADGMTLTSAYREAYAVKPTTQPSSVNEAGSRMMRDPRIKQRVDRLIREKELAIANRAVSDRERVTDKLRNWMDGVVEPSVLQVRSAELLGKASGLFAKADENAKTGPRSSDEVMNEIESILDKAMAAQSSIDDRSDAVDAEWTEVPNDPDKSAEGVPVDPERSPDGAPDPP